WPGEGGVYLWAKQVFGDFHGFLSGWCYWTNNMLYVPTIMLYFVGVSVFILGPGHEGLAENKAFTVAVSLVLLALLAGLNIAGAGIGKWIGNLGGIGTGVASTALIVLGAVVWFRFGTTATVADFRIPVEPKFLLNSFGVICYGLVGLELASIMGDEIQEPEKTLPGAVLWGGVLSGVLYIAATLTLLLAVDKGEINVLQGIVQAVSHMADRVGIGWIRAPFALMLSFSIAGIGSVWLAGSARIPFVAGLDSYLPAWLGKVHPKWGTPYPAILVHASISMLLVLINSFGSGVQEMFQRLLSLSVVLQLIPFLYMFGALLRLPADGKGRFGPAVLKTAGATGLATTALGIVLVFFPARQISSLGSYLAWMFGGTAAFIGLAAFFFFTGRARTARLPAP
ncbi:MAG: APC family permease, partial [Elusimicrobia bacterium]|nr:APC family permease [Elusimicrobiota bacterium]